MNPYSRLLYFLKELAEGHPVVNTVTKGDPQLIDMNKANIFPLLHIAIENGRFIKGQVIAFTITLQCLTERDLNKEVVSNKFWRQDNEVDNHNETLSILNYMWTYIYRDWNDDNITTSEDGNFEKIEFEKGNILDGWSLTFDVELSNIDLNLCELVASVEYVTFNSEIVTFNTIPVIFYI